ncbi:MAG: hypothetical protein AAGI01_11050, partial [Myxococcota bacterium]
RERGAGNTSAIFTLLALHVVHQKLVFSAPRSQYALPAVGLLLATLASEDKVAQNAIVALHGTQDSTSVSGARVPERLWSARS